MKDAEWASLFTETYFRASDPRKPPVTQSLHLRTPSPAERSRPASSLPTLEGAVAAPVEGVPISVVAIFLRPEKRRRSKVT